MTFYSIIIIFSKIFSEDFGDGWARTAAAWMISIETRAFNHYATGSPPNAQRHYISETLSQYCFTGTISHRDIISQRHYISVLFHRDIVSVLFHRDIVSILFHRDNILQRHYLSEILSQYCFAETLQSYSSSLKRCIF